MRMSLLPLVSFALLFSLKVQAQDPEWTEADTGIYESFKNIIGGCHAYFVMDSRTVAEDRQPGVELLSAMQGEPAQIVRILLWHWEPDEGLRRMLLVQWHHHNLGGETRAHSLYSRLEQSLSRYDTTAKVARAGELALLLNGDPAWLPNQNWPQSRARQAEVTARAHGFFSELDEEFLFSTDPERRKLMYEAIPKMIPSEDFRPVDTGLVGWLFLYESEPKNRALVLERLPDTYSGGGAIGPHLIYEHLLDSFGVEERAQLLSDLHIAQSRLYRIASEARVTGAEAPRTSDEVAVTPRKWIVSLGMAMLGLAVVGLWWWVATRRKVAD